MDLGTIIGKVAVWVLVLVAMALGVGVGAYIDPASVLIVIGGSLGAVLIGAKMETVVQIGKIFMVAIKPTIIDYADVIQKMVNYNIQARRDGLLSLEASVNNEENEFLKKGLMMVIDGVEPDAVKALLEVEIESTNNRHQLGIGLFKGWGGYAGAYGLIGTLVGLVAMLVNMSDPSAIGPAMAVALLTTLYGAMLANMVTGPISAILEIRNDEELLGMDITIQGIVAIQAGDNPRILESKLMAYLPIDQRKSQFE